jgi:hypothetical protein
VSEATRFRLEKRQQKLLRRCRRLVGKLVAAAQKRWFSEKSLSLKKLLADPAAQA